MAFDDEDLELAFQIHVIDLLCGADLATTTSEQALVDRWFPRETLQSRGFSNPDGTRTARLHDAAVEALATLPGRLVQARKLELLGACFRIAVADREFRSGEGTVLLMAARLLGLSDEVFDGFLGDRPTAMGMSAAWLDRADE